ncbi:cytochrome P460 family protein [Flocculibacter collagenilyticus]|uniref:cytochrome P460 family protein n=1 Tax=Flocculibacter collagenilyticus TaxID=2744479 RepID=UPI0018F44EE6|nr:cytochrome P460 family protein [Flocculibacter collagenilyticus]
MRKLILVVIVVLFAMTFISAANPFGIYPFKIPKEYEQQLKDYRTSWQRMSGFEYSGLHWQQFITIFVKGSTKTYENNYMEYLQFYQDYDEDEDEEDVEKPKFMKYEPGSIVLKENFSAASGTPNDAISVTMMIKHKPGYSPEYGDWEYVQFSKEGQIMLAGKASDPVIMQTCANCHNNVADRDYIFANFYSRK